MPRFTFCVEGTYRGKRVLSSRNIGESEDVSVYHQYMWPGFRTKHVEIAAVAVKDPIIPIFTNYF